MIPNDAEHKEKLLYAYNYIRKLPDPAYKFRLAYFWKIDNRESLFNFRGCAC